MGRRTNIQIMVYLRKEPYRAMTENHGYTQTGKNQGTAMSVEDPVSL